jgi:hypothetical protein
MSGMAAATSPIRRSGLRKVMGGPRAMAQIAHFYTGCYTPSGGLFRYVLLTCPNEHNVTIACRHALLRQDANETRVDLSGFYVVRHDEIINGEVPTLTRITRPPSTQRAHCQSARLSTLISMGAARERVA